MTTVLRTVVVTFERVNLHRSNVIDIDGINEREHFESRNVLEDMKPFRFANTFLFFVEKRCKAETL